MGFHRLLALILTTSLVACTSNSNNGSGPNRFHDGTSDSGGGNGAEDRAYEAYIIQPEQLPAYKNLIAPKIAKLISLNPANVDKTLPLIQRWLLYKTWYIAPVSLDTISRDVIGVSFSSDQTQQLALQTKKSIWIDSRVFNRMDLQSQATLIIHEMVMSLYYLRFKSWEDICSEKIYPEINCTSQDKDLLNEVFPGSTPKPFDSDDYENIRSVTGAFLGDFPFQSANDIDDFLISHKFDRRFTFSLGFGAGGGGPDKHIIIDNSVKISSSELTDIFAMAKKLNLWPDQCRGLRFKDPFDCNFNVGTVTRQIGNGYQLPLMAIDVHSTDTAKPLDFTVTRMPSNEIDGSSLEFVDQKKKIFYFTYNPDPWPTPLIPGTFFRTATVVLSQDLRIPNSPRTLLGIQSVPGIVTGLHPQIPDECVYAKPATRSTQDDVVLVHSRYLEDFDKGLLAARASVMPPYTTCRKF